MNASAGQWSRRLTEADVLWIRARLAEGELDQRQIAAHIGTSYQTVNLIRIGRTHRDVELPQAPYTKESVR